MEASSSSSERAIVSEREQYSISSHAPPLRTFALSLRGVTAEVCTLGASLIQLMVPSPKGIHDVVLGYKSPVEMFTTENPTYLCAVVGRVANRIAQGRLQIETNGREYPLAINNHPNHLHGGEQGFSRQVWDAEIIIVDEENKAVKFTLASPSGDQGYPGTVKCAAVYSLKPTPDAEHGVSLCLELTAELHGDESTPINLAQHSYFNLSRHDDPHGVLEHKLTMPSNFYTPLDEETSIPTRQVKSLNSDCTMDWRAGRHLRDAIEDYGLSKAAVDEKIVARAVSDRYRDFTDLDVQPFGFDHNYVVHASSKPDADGLHLVGTLEHEATKRIMRIRTSAPGVQLYTANYLSALKEEKEDSQSAISSSPYKDEATYLRWQGVCLETQAYPDSILVDEELHPEFAKGKCTILTSCNRSYNHTVVYDLYFEKTINNNQISKLTTFRGNDSDGKTYESPEEMWQEEGVTLSGAENVGWYDRASQYYEANCPETIDGVLGGFANISDVDLEGSRDFVTAIGKLRGGDWKWSQGAAAECGAGIGRVSKGLLLPLGVTRCDLIESSSRLLYAAPDYIGDDAGRCRFYCQGLQDWTPATQTYSIIFVQWVFCYLTDADAVRFLQRCGDALLKDGGVIVLKENTCDDADFVLDREDASVTRSVPYLLHLIEKAGLRIVLQQFQNNFPSSIFPVPMIALEKVDR